MFARNRPKQYNLPFKTEDDILEHAKTLGIPTAATMPSDKKIPFFTGHHNILTEKVPYNHQSDTRKLSNQFAFA